MYIASSGVNPAVSPKSYRYAPRVNVGHATGSAATKRVRERPRNTRRKKALLLALGRSPGDELHVLYGVLPPAVSFIAEQPRIGSADTVLAERGLEIGRDVGELPDDEQRVVVLSIVRREMGVMMAACLIVVALALRAATTSGAF